MLIPSIDLQAGRIVQLVQGERLAVETDDIDGWISRFAAFSLIQLIDLDAAKGSGHNRGLVRAICAQLPCQVGGGIRSAADAVAAIDGGAVGVIVGSAMFDREGARPDRAATMASAIGTGRLVAAVDGRGGHVVIDGWKTTLPVTVLDAIRALEPCVSGFLATLVDGEGLLGGVDFNAANALRAATRKPLILAGGIRSMAEVDALDALGVDAVVGMAIYTGVIDLEQARSPRSVRFES